MHRHFKGVLERDEGGEGVRGREEEEGGERESTVMSPVYSLRSDLMTSYSPAAEKHFHFVILSLGLPQCATWGLRNFSHPQRSHTTGLQHMPRSLVLPAQVVDQSSSCC